MNHYDVIIVGAGAAGVGMGVALKDFGVTNFLILEKEEIGSTFKKWTKETKFLTPSFQSTQFGLMDLNAIAINTSPGLGSGLEHFNGDDYVQYLEMVSEYFELPIKEHSEVSKVVKKKNRFQLKTTTNSYSSKFLIWATGEFEFPLDKVFKGSELCLHSSQIKSYSDLTGDHYIIIGGYESGMDAAFNLSNLGKEVTILDKGVLDTPNSSSQDPSITLSQYTNQRMMENEHDDNVHLFDGEEVVEVEHAKNGKYYVFNEDGDFYESFNPPILATGFRGGHRLIKEMFRYGDHDRPLLNEKDESIITKNLFLVGPHVQHENAVFCFIYKFRQRFGIIANHIALQFDKDTSEAIKFYKENQMFLDDLSCCQTDCIC
jgi:putative flavoprotein involved in K+ transport